MTTAAEIKVRIVSFNEKGEREESVPITLDELHRTIEKNDLSMGEMRTATEDGVWEAHVSKK